MSPKVSILMPIYNTASYLKEAVDSILAQTYTDFELITLDDCSPDNAQEILDHYSDERIVRYKGVTNRGLSNVLNVGLTMAKGEYIARMDSDDVSFPERLSTQIQFMEQHPEVDLCSCGMELFEARSEVWTRNADPRKVELEALFFSPILHASSLWRKDSFEKHGLIFDQDMVPAEDYDLWVRALLCRLTLVNMPQVLYRYRIRPNQATSNSEACNAKVLEIRRKYLQATLPALSEGYVEDFLEMTTLSWRRFILFMWAVVRSNGQSRFFDQKLLVKRLVKYYKGHKHEEVS